MKKSIIFVFCFLTISLANAHDVHVQVKNDEAAVLTLSYEKNTPVAYEAYELYSEESTLPFQVGRTSKSGQIVFMPGKQIVWRLKTISKTGHEVDRSFNVNLPTKKIQHVAFDIERASFSDGVLSGLLIALFIALLIRTWERFRK